jgi:hypothetical protein
LVLENAPQPGWAESTIQQVSSEDKALIDEVIDRLTLADTSYESSAETADSIESKVIILKRDRKK